MLDMLIHVAAELGHAPESPGEAAGILVEEGLLSRDDYDFIRKLIGFHNIVVHSYTSVDLGLVERILGRREY